MKTYYTVKHYFAKGIKTATVSFDGLESFTSIDNAVNALKIEAELNNQSCVLVSPNTLALSVTNHNDNDLCIVELLENKQEF